MKTFLACDKFTDLEDINQYYQKLFEQLGITAYAFTYYAINPSSRRKAKYEFASPSIQSWHQYYLESEFEDIDETLRWSQQAVLPIYWQITEQLKTAKTPREIRLRKDAVTYGIVDGFSIPIHGPSQDFATLTIYRLQDKPALNQTQMPEWLFLAYHLYSAIRKNLSTQKKKNHKYELTPREIQCLKYTAENYLAEDIAELLSITVRTAHFHLQNVNKKMGVKSKYQAVTKAVLERII